MNKTQSSRPPEYPESATQENTQSRNILERTHQPQTVGSEHQSDDNTDKSETAIQHESAQHSTRQAQQIAYRVAIGYTACTVQFQNRLVGCSGEKKTDIRQYGQQGKRQQQQT